ncbi:MAG TPA: hypothetical protein VHN58_13035 [Croceicoccus sp.]|nr:hypothetical protein [Croceicoccus sp.]
MIVIGDDIEAASAMHFARRISMDASIPVLMVTGDPATAAMKLQQAASYSGPFHLNEIERAVETALNPILNLQ